VQQQLGRPAPALLTVNRVVAWLSSRAHWPRSLALKEPRSKVMIGG